MFTPRETELCEQDSIKPLTATSILNKKTASALSKNKCIRPCSRIYRPVCGTNGQETKTFSNECLMNQHNCMTKESEFIEFIY